MTIKQQGGIFGRNPTFNDVTVDGTLTSSNLAVDTDTLYVDSTNDRVGINISSPTESLDLGTSHQNIRVSSRSHVGSIYSSQSTVLGHAVKADTTADQMIVTETNSGGGAPAAIKMTSGTIQFHTAASGTAGAAFNSEGARFTPSGNLAFVSGNGIDFSATSGTGTSELFDDYEEGTWTPTLTTDGTDFDSVSYNAITAGRYTKVGNLVHIQCRLLTSAVTVGSASGYVQIGGLPFTSVSNSVGTDDGSSAISIAGVSGFAGEQPSAGNVAANSTKCYLLYRTAADGPPALTVVSDVGSGNNVIFSATYISA